MALLEVDNLKVHYKISNGVVKGVDDVSFKLDRGETMGLVGESGCGKTTAAFATMRLLPKNGFIVNGKINFDGKYIAKFERGDLKDDLPTGDEIEMTVTGKVFYNGGNADFGGSDNIRVIGKNGMK